ncbi:MAG: transmembrane 220 family protein [Leptospiraceae bacterium]|nr:transmembrane 220 family protein [Leptospiraceae bacterium]
MKVFNWFFVICFIIFAGLQYNDPDPYLWVPIYLYGAALCFYASRNIVKKKFYFIGITFYAVYAIFLFFETDGVLKWIRNYNLESITGSMEAEKPWIEKTREFFGLIILIVVLSINLILFKDKKFVEKIK